MLFLQGTRDRTCPTSPSLRNTLVRDGRADARLHVVQEADQNFQTS